MQQFKTHTDGVTPIRVGDSLNFNYVPLKSDDSPGFEAPGSVTATPDDPTIATVVPNPGIGNSSGSTVTAKAVGTVTINPAAVNENAKPYHTPFQVVISPAAPPPETDHFQIVLAN